MLTFGAGQVVPRFVRAFSLKTEKQLLTESRNKTDECESNSFVASHKT